MLCDLRALGDIAVVRIGADIYLDNHEEFDAFLENEVSSRFSKVILDASNVRAICSAGLGAIVKAHKRAREAGGEVVFVQVQKKVHALFEITRLTSVINIMEDEAAALRHLQDL